jgi:hypothetical protein
MWDHLKTPAPLAKRYGEMTDQMGDCEEIKPVSEMALRQGN